MNSFTASRWENQRRLEVVAMPMPNEGLRRALIGSFRSIPAMPQEFIRLLDRVR